MTKYESDPSVGLNAAVAATLNGERAASGMTFEQLAAETGISKRSLMRYLSSTERIIDIAVIQAVAATFGLTANDVMELAERRLAREELRRAAQEPRHDDGMDNRKDA